MNAEALYLQHYSAEPAPLHLPAWGEGRGALKGVVYRTRWQILHGKEERKPIWVYNSAANFDQASF
ncbi:hypothetical protein Kalk_16450 [Ketobacter alkanivorans]|uniref:Uncharacterized protein n=1 Tax=Ketobacter alkanivorans TaxID=1917421 RepID=A0A2K9LNU0_9GAMM|nr:hypothetical protein Kalk_16450 [Ketobacter alkanivorans]